LGDFLVLSIDFDNKSRKLTSFCVLQIHSTGEETHKVILFDASHGVVHTHKFYKNPGHREELDLNISKESFNWCKENILVNWKKYRNRFIKKWLSDA